MTRKSELQAVTVVKRDWKGRVVSSRQVPVKVSYAAPCPSVGAGHAAAVKHAVEAAEAAALKQGASFPNRRKTSDDCFRAQVWESMNTPDIRIAATVAYIREYERERCFVPAPIQLGGKVYGE